MRTVWVAFLVAGMMAAVACSDSTNPTADVLADTIQDPGTETLAEVTETGPGDVEPDARPEVAVDVPVETTPEVCTPACTGKACGPNGCGGDCGTCGDGKVCSEAGQCEACTNPTTWSPVGMVATGAFPKDAAVVEAVCPDFSGDSKGDNALAAFADDLNPPLQAEITRAFYGAVAEFVGVTDWTNTASFTFNAFAAGTETAGGTELYVNPLFYNPATCQPYLQAPGASLTAGVLAVGPKDLTMSYTFQGMDLTATVKNTQVKGTLTHTADGVTLTDGVAAGVITKDVVDALVVKLQARCAQANPPGWCANANLLDLVPAAFDLDLNDDGTKDAMSICVQFTLKPATLLGYGVEN